MLIITQGITTSNEEHSFAYFGPAIKDEYFFRWAGMYLVIPYSVLWLCQGKTRNFAIDIANNDNGNN